jgi:hypothetical protein
MAEYDIHVSHETDAGWTVIQAADTESRLYGQFRVRAHAEAFARALAHRGRVSLIVHHRDGREARVPASALSYPARL